MARPVIEDGVPLPRLARDLRRWHEAYPIDQLKRGQSVLVTGVARTTVSAYCSRLGRTYEPRKLFSTHGVVENGVEGVRVWRVE